MSPIIRAILFIQIWDLEEKREEDKEKSKFYMEIRSTTIHWKSILGNYLANGRVSGDEEGGEGKREKLMRCLDILNVGHYTWKGGAAELCDWPIHSTAWPI